MPRITIKNKLRNIEPLFVGTSCPTAIKLQVGVTAGFSSIQKEIDKAKAILKYNPHLIADLTISSTEEIERFQKELARQVPKPITSVPWYEVYLSKKDNKYSKENVVNVIRSQAERGVDLMTMHPTIRSFHLPILEQSKRYIKVTSRAGGLIYEYLKQSKKDNPLYECFDDILQVLKEYHIILSLGHVFRRGCVADDADELFESEMELQKELMQRALKQGVQVVVEVGGHMKLPLVEEYIKKCKQMFEGAILCCMGPLTTDTATGYDHVTAAMGAVIAGRLGVDMFVNITPAEHIGLPTDEEQKEGLIIHKLAASIIDTEKLNDYSKENVVARLRRDSQKCFVSDKELRQVLIDPFNPRVQVETSKFFMGCTMCHRMCPLVRLPPYKERANDVQQVIKQHQHAQE